MKKILLSSIAAGTLLLGACGTTETEESGPDTSANLLEQNLLPLVEGQKFWYTEKDNGYIFSIEIGDKSSNKDNSKTYYRATFADEDTTEVKFITKTVEGYSLSEDIGETLTLILPDSIPSDSGSFGSSPTMDYTWKDNRLTAEFSDDELLFKFDKIVFAKDTGIIELTDNGDRKDYVYSLDSITSK